jgi:hypothetical protein
MVLCSEAKLVPLFVVRDIWNNKEAALLALDDCASRMKCLVGWIRAAKAGETVVENCGTSSPVAPKLARKTPTR